MSTMFDVVAIVGSFRRGSYTCRLVRALAKVAPLLLRIGIVEISALQAYTGDLDVPLLRF